MDNRRGKKRMCSFLFIFSKWPADMKTNANAINHPPTSNHHEHQKKILPTHQHQTTHAPNHTTKPKPHRRHHYLHERA
jgi:hypothetical protein